MITVIITVHEALQCHLQRAVDSVVWQLEAADELIVIGDGDGYFPQFKNPGEHRSIIRSHGGISCARNLGFAVSVNPWVKFLDADDLLAPFALNAMRKVINAAIPHEYAVILGQMLKVKDGLVSEFRNPVQVETQIENQNPALVSQSFIRKSTALAVGGFDERIHFEEDWDFWLKLNRAGHKFGYVDAPVCFYWISTEARAAKEKTRDHTVEGMDVRDYLWKKYNLELRGAPRPKP